MSITGTRHTVRRVLLSGIIGTAVEWYDFMIHAAATGLVFNRSTRLKPRASAWADTQAMRARTELIQQ